VRGRGGEETVVRVTRPPAPECPPASESVDKFDDAARKGVIHAMLDPESIDALKQGLRAEKLDERRQWWKLALSHILPLLEGAQAGAGGVKIVFDQRVPAPAHEEGSLRGGTVDVTER